MEMDTKARNEIHEGGITRKIEQQTAKIPSINWLALAVGSMGLSFVTEIFFKRRELGNFFGLWVPSLMLIGVYNKVVKLEANMERNLLH